VRANKHEEIVRASKPDARNVRNAKFMLQSLLRERIDTFDQSPDHLNVRNGVLDLRTGTLLPHRPHQRFTYCLPVAYAPDAGTTAWRQFLRQVVGGGEEVVAFLQTAVGYSVTGHTREEKLFYLYGPTRSGKGTFTETLLTLLGKPLATEVDFTTFTRERDNDASNFDLAPLKPARLLIASESSRHQLLHAAKIKQLTGGNDIRCCFKHRDHFEYRPGFTIWLVSNHDVHADPDDTAAWGRVVRLEFPHSFSGREDTTLKERMKRPENLQAVLAWAVEGATRWYAQGLRVPPSCRTGSERPAQTWTRCNSGSTTARSAPPTALSRTRRCGPILKPGVPQTGRTSSGQRP
jgi:putative DNA primase/helicase